MRAFISVSLQKRHQVSEPIAAIQSVLDALGISSLLFVDQYRFEAGDAKIMMEQARHDIDASDVLIAELTHKALGVGIEVGYAVGVGKPVIYVCHEFAEHSTTAAGIATYTLFYRTPDDLKSRLRQILEAL